MVKIEEQDIGRSIHILSRLIKRRIDEAVSKYNVTSVQCAVIEFISHKKGDVFAKDIESKFSMRRATVAEILSLMEKKDIIKRLEYKEDGRLKKLILTQKALKIKKDINKEIEKFEIEIKQGFSEKELQEFVKLINKMSSNLSK